MTPYASFTALLCCILLQATECRRRQIWDTSRDEPVALPPSFRDTPTLVTYREGQLARLECSVNNLGTKKVIWRRKSDLNPLTIDRKTFVDDDRISVENEPLTPDWYLIIKQVRIDDGGHYECQVSSKDRYLRRDIQLVVKPGQFKTNTNPEITISGKTFVEKNHKLRLVCNATGGQNSPDDLDVDWFLNGQKLTTDSDKKMRIQKRVSVMKKTISSILEVTSADMHNAGIYVCRASDLSIASARVDVLNADTNNVKREKDTSSHHDSGKQGRHKQDGDGNSAHRNFHSTPLLPWLAALMAVGLSRTQFHWLIYPT